MTEEIMQWKPEGTVEEARQLRSFINDLMSLLALPAMWSGRESSQIIDTLLDSLLGMLRLDFIYARLNDTITGQPIEAARTAQRQTDCQPQKIGRALEPWLSKETVALPVSIPNPCGEGQARIARLSLGLQQETGLVVAGSHRMDFPTDNESLLLRAAANQTAIALDGAQIAKRRIQAEEGLREQTEVVETINLIGQMLSAELDQQKLVQALTDAATELTGAAFGSFFYNVLNESGESYLLYTLSGAPRHAFEHFPMPRNTEIFGPTFRGEGVVRIDDVKKDPRYGKNSPYYGLPPGHLPVTSYLAIPVISRSGEVLGGLFFGHPEEGVFTERHERILTGLAAQAAIAMDNARLFEFAQRERAAAESAREQVADILESITDSFTVYDNQWRMTYLNREAENMLPRLGVTREQVSSNSIWEMLPALKGSVLYEQLHKAVAEQSPVQFETFIPQLNGWYEMRAYPSKEGLAVYSQNITERRRAVSLLDGQRRVLELMAQGAPLTEVLEALIHTIEEQSSEEAVASILLLDKGGAHLRHGSAPSLPESYNEAIDGIAIGPSVGSCGTAAYLGKPVIVTDIDKDPLWADFRELALKYNLRACWSTPILSTEGKVLGTFAMYYREPRAPSEQDFQLISMVARTAAIAIERKQAEEASLHLAAIVESSDDAIISKTLEGIILSWNKGAERIFGYKADEVIGQSIYLLIPPERRDEEPVILGKLRNGERIDHYDTVRVTKDGRAVNISLTVSPIRDSSGEIIAASKIARDVTEHKQIEREREQLLVSEKASREEAERRSRESQMIASATREFSTSLHLQDLLPVICRAAREIAEADGATFVKREGDHVLYMEEDAIEPLWKGHCFPITSCISGWAILEHKPAIVEDINVDQRLPIEAYEPTFVKSLVMIPVRSRDPLGAIGVYWANKRRASERQIALLEALADAAHIAIINTQLYEQMKSAREQAEEANRLKDEFLATVSHELRTPLNAMLGWTRMLRTGKLDDDTYARALETIERNAKSQAQLIEDLLDVSRIISGKMRLDVQPVELAPVVQAAIDSVRPAADAKAIRLNIVLDPMAGPVSGDPTRLQQIVWNLLSNAIKFTPKDGRVLVRLERVNSHTEITVSDTGIGISPEFLPYVFDRFRQADSTLTRRQSGLGLGLAIVRHLVELHGGSINAYSAGEGQGATFIIRLPLMVVRDVKPYATATIERKHPTDWPDLPFECPPALNGLRVLVVDDEPDARQLLTTILTRCKAEVMTAASAAAALGALERIKVDVLVSDIEMPDEDGYSLIRKVRAMEGEKNGRVPAAALTAHAGVGDRMRALSAGFDIHVPKPVEPAELVAVIASLATRIGKRSGS